MTGQTPAPRTSTSGAAAPRFSVVIPTHQRRDVVCRAVQCLAAQGGPSFEVVVVADGSSDGTADAVRALDVPVDVRVVEQVNAGAARARNHGAQLARGDVLLFLDDDMLAEPGLLEAHARAHSSGADAVLGHIPVHPDSPRSVLLAGLTEWADNRRDRLVQPGAALTVADFLTGQLSVRRSVFDSLGGFDEDFTRDGSFGGEDTDFGRRLFNGGFDIQFAPDAVTRQLYVVRPAQYLTQWHEAGRADAAYMRKHPGDIAAVHLSHHASNRINRFVWRPLAAVPPVSRVVAAIARGPAVRVATERPDDPRARRLFFRVRDLEYWRGMRAGGGSPAPRAARVLCYHAISDLRGVSVVEQYGVPARLLRAQLRLLTRAGFTFVTLDEMLRSIAVGGGLPRRPVLVTFDDCYTDLLTDGVPVLRAERVPAVAFAVAGRTGESNDWDQRLGAPTLPLLDEAGLHALQQSGVEIGVHGSTHRPLPSVPAGELDAEIAGAAAVLTGLGLRAPRVFAYPHGEHDLEVRERVARAGLQAAFTVQPGLVDPNTQDPYALNRIEILRRDGAGMRFLIKVATAGMLPAYWTRLPAPVRRGAGRALRAPRRLGRALAGRG